MRTLMDCRDTFVAAFVAISLGYLLSGGCEPKPAPVHLALMATSGIQSRIAPFTQTLYGTDRVVGGLERIAGAAGEIRGQVDGALLLSSGDDLMAPMYWMFHGEPEMRGMSMAGYDAMTPGNHEFDLGPEVYAEALGYGGVDIVSANIAPANDALAARIKPYTIKETAGVRIGIFGLMTPELPRITTVTDAEVHVNDDLVSVARAQVTALEAERCDLIVALTHTGLTLDRQLADRVAGIDIIVGGHDHAYANEIRNGVLIVQDGLPGAALGVLKFTFVGGAVHNPTWETRLLDAPLVDPAVEVLVAGFVDQYDEQLDRTIGASSVDLDARYEIVRRQESNLGDLAADSWLAALDGASIAMINSGGIRGNKIYPAGPISYKNVTEILPFRNSVSEATLTGAQLKQVLEISASAIRFDGDAVPDAQRAPTGGFLQVAGLRIMIDPMGACFQAEYNGTDLVTLIEPGSRVLSVEVFLGDGWAPLDLEATYNVLVTDWTASGGDGYYLFKDPSVTIQDTTTVTTDLLAKFVEDNSPLTQQPEGRITYADR